jgi:hypothetical protein
MLVGGDSGWVHQISEAWPVGASIIGGLIYLAGLVARARRSDEEVVKLGNIARLQAETTANQDKRIELLESRQAEIKESACINSEKIDEHTKTIGYLEGRMDRGTRRQ